jgi:two-component system sensor kinase FixL
MVLSALALQPLLQHASLLILALPIVLGSALLGGFLPGIAVGGAALCLGRYAEARSDSAPADITDLFIYAVYVVIFSAVGEERMRRIRRADADAARLRLVEERVAKISRLNALGELAGTLAHEINQPLSAISSFLGALQRKAERPDAEPRELAALAARAAGQVTRAHEIITRVRARLSGEVTLTELELPTMLAGTLTLPSVEARLAGVAVELDVARDAQTVCADAVQLQQVLVNLIGNALDAMEGLSIQMLTIKSRVLNDDLVTVTVSDTGPGLSDDIRERLFEPFATSKEHGTGLGLSISRSIARSFGGELIAQGRAGRGATFALRLPRPRQDNPRH